MPIHTNSEVKRIEKDIRSLMDNGKSDNEIRELLKLELRTFQRHKKRIYEQDQKVWFSITQEQLGTELLRLKQSLEETYKITKEMAQDPKCEYRIEALNCMNDSRLSIVHLLSEYPDFIRKIPQPDEQDSTIKPSTLKRVHS